MSISTVRRATVRVRPGNDPEAELRRVSAYLPSNYSAAILHSGEIDITGTDSSGWTLDGYVIPRLASGLIFAEEVTA